MKRSARSSHCRGAALLLVLATLVLTTVSCAIAARSAATLTATRQADHAARIADELLRSADAPIQHWLAESAPTAALPPEVDEPRLDVLHDVIPLGAFDAEITITAFDQLGMVPWSLLDSASPITSALPPELARLDLDAESTDAPFGLDAIERGVLAYEWRIFPTSDENDQPAIGALIATHNTSGGGGGSGGGSGGGGGGVNVNTAPRKLLEVAMREAGRGGIEAILAARERGEAVSFAARSSRSSQQSIAIVSRSDTWSFRIDIRVGPVMRSWWCVYQSNECVQRLVIPE